jgi:hypothetical protein
MANAVMFAVPVLCASTKIYCILSRLVRNWIFISFPGFDVGKTEPWETNVDYATLAGPRTQPILLLSGLEHLHQPVDSPALAYWGSSCNRLSSKGWLSFLENGCV